MKSYRCLAWAGLGFALPAYAQAGATEAPESVTPVVQQVIVQQQKNSLQKQTGSASAGTISAAEFEALPVQRPAEILERVPGLIVSQHSGSGKANQYFMRGFNLDHGTDLSASVAGLLINMPSHAHGQGYLDLNLLIPELVSEVQFRKGPYYAGDGDFSLVGANRIQYVSALEAPLLVAEAGSGRERRLMHANSGEIAGGHWIAALELAGADGPWQVPEDARKLNSFLRWRSSAAGGDIWQWSVLAYRNRWNATSQVPERAVQFGLIDRFGSLDPSEGGDTQRVGLHVQRELVEGERRDLWQAYRMQYRLNLYSNPTWYLNDADKGDQITQSEQRHISGASWLRSQPLSNALLPLRLETGFSTRYDQISPLALYGSVQRLAYETRSLHRVNWWQGAVFAQLQAELHPQWRLSGGLRAEKVRADVRDLLKPLNSGVKSESAISPNLNLSYQPAPELAFYLNAGRGFHSNDARGATIQTQGDAAESLRATPLMSPGKGWELGMRSAQWLNGLESSLVFWQLTTDSELTYVPDDASTEAGRPARRYGWEMSHQYRMNRHWWLELDMAWSHSRYTDISEAGNRVTDAPERTASLAIRYEKGPWEWGLRGRYMGSRALTEDNSVRSHAAVLWHGRVAYRFSHQLTLSLDGLNLLNRSGNDMEYWYSSRMKHEAATVEDRHWHPATPRSWRLGVRWQW